MSVNTFEFQSFCRNVKMKWCEVFVSGKSALFFLLLFYRKSRLFVTLPNRSVIPEQSERRESEEWTDSRSCWPSQILIFCDNLEELRHKGSQRGVIAETKIKVYETVRRFHWLKLNKKVKKELKLESFSYSLKKPNTKGTDLRTALEKLWSSEICKG